MIKKTIYIFILFIFICSCETMSSVKRGLTGEKKKSTDEFLIQNSIQSLGNDFGFCKYKA